jgi:hypothetical protein
MANYRNFLIHLYQFKKKKKKKRKWLHSVKVQKPEKIRVNKRINQSLVKMETLHLQNTTLQDI